MKQNIGKLSEAELKARRRFRNQILITQYQPLKYYKHGFSKKKN